MTAAEIVEEMQAAPTPEAATAQVSVLVGAFEAKAEQAETQLREAFSNGRLELEEVARNEAAAIRSHNTALGAALRSQFAAMQAGVDQQAEASIAGLTQTFAGLEADVDGERDARLAASRAGTERHIQTLAGHRSAELAQLNAITEREATRSAGELDQAATAAEAVGRAEASRHPNGKEGAAEMRAAALDVARQSAQEIRSKKGGIRGSLQEKRAEFAGRYDTFVQQGSERIRAALPEIQQQYDSGAQQRRAELGAQRTAGVAAIRQRRQAERASLGAALTAGLAALARQGSGLLGQIHTMAQSASRELQQREAAVVELISAARSQARQLVEAERSSVTGTTERLTEMGSALGQLTAEGRQQAQQQSADVANGLREAAAGFRDQAEQFAAGIAQGGQAALAGAAAAITGARDSAAEQGNVTVTATRAQLLGVHDEADRQIGEAVAQAHSEMRGVTSSFDAEVRSATNESIREAKKPLTDPLETRVEAAAEETQRGWLAGVLAGLAEIVVGFLIVLAIAVVVAALVGLTLGGALLVVGAAFLVIAFVVAVTQRSTANPEAGWGAIALTALADATGVTGIYEGVTNNDIMTGRNLGLSDYERGRRGTVGVGQLIGTILLAVGGVQAGRGAMPVTRPTRLGGGRFSLVENVRGVWRDLVTMGEGVRNLGRRLSDWVRGRKGAPDESVPPEQTPGEERPPGEESAPRPAEHAQRQAELDAILRRCSRLDERAADLSNQLPDKAAVTQDLARVRADAEQARADAARATRRELRRTIADRVREAERALGEIERRIDAMSSDLGLPRDALDALDSFERAKSDPIGDVNSDPNHNHYRAARREAAGEQVAWNNQRNRPFDHISDLQQAFLRLQRILALLERYERRPPEGITERGLDVLLSKLAEVRAARNRLQNFLSEIGQVPPPIHTWPPGVYTRPDGVRFQLNADGTTVQLD